MYACRCATLAPYINNTLKSITELLALGSLS